jgi:ribonuclease III family protein
MEESLSYLELIKKEFSCDEIDLRTYSPLTLAYMGDCVYDLIIRTVIIGRGNRSANDLHKLAVQYVKAKAQSDLIECMIANQLLSPEEESIYRRGRNAKSYTKAKNADIADYSRATGLEALLGFLYLANRMERAVYLVKESVRLLELHL